MGVEYVLHFLEYKIIKEPKECRELAFRLKQAQDYAEWNKQRLYREGDALVEAECDAIIAKRKLRELKQYAREHMQGLTNHDELRKCVPKQRKLYSFS